MKSKVLVTGAAGFIGSHLTEKLIELGYSVFGIDNLSVGRRENLNSIKSDKFKFIDLDISNFNVDFLASGFKGIKKIYHLGALADIVPSIKSPREYFLSNVQGTFNMLELARQINVSKFLYAASSSCYGIPNVYPTPESAKISPEYPYALTKYLGEELVLHWGKVYKLPVISLRLFNVYGPRARTSGTYGAVFGVFLAQKRANKPLTVVGDGTQTRDFTYVSDVVDAFICASKSDLTGEVFNVGSGGSYSVNELVKLIGGNIINIPKRPGEPDTTFADINKIKSKLGWEPKVRFETGVAQMLSDLESWKDAPVWSAKDIEQETRLWFEYLGKKE